MSVEPLKAKTMTLEELQLRTIDLIKQVRKQLKRAHFEEGMTDNDFMRNVLEPFEHDIKTDRYVIRKRREAEESPSPTGGK